MILDVGCGSQPKGHVNTDRVKTLKVSNFIQCDAHFLPFRNKSFEVVYASHLLEHCECPLKVLKELGRVAKYIVYLHVPYGDKHPDDDPTHLYSWTMQSFKNLLSKVFLRVEVYTTERIAYKFMATKYINRSLIPDLLLLFLRKIRHTLLWRTQITAICYKR